MRRAVLPLLALAMACGSSKAPPDSGLDAAVDGGQDGGRDAGPCADEYQRCPMDFTLAFHGEQSVELRGNFRPTGWGLGVPMTRDGGVWQVRVPVPTGEPIEYKFVVDGGTWILDPANPTVTVSDGGSGAVNSLRAAVVCSFPTCSTTFDWRDAVIYFVLVDRFLDADPSNDCSVAGADPAGNYRGGDWKGVTQRITEGYFTDLGVNTLWLSVPVKNSTEAGHGLAGDPHLYSGYHGYWPKELDQHESCLGTKQDLVDLISAAHARHLKVLLDFAMVHLHRTGSVYSQHPDWFWPNSFGAGNCICGDGCDWNAQADRCWFADYLPHWNYTVPAARAYSVDRTVQWAKDTGADGFRLDAIKHVDGAWLLDLRQRLTREVLAPGDAWGRVYLVGETFDYSNRAYIKSFIEPATRLDGQFDFPLRLNLLKAVVMRQSGYGLDQLAAFMDDNDAFYGPGTVMSTWLGNHDLGRVIHQGEDTPLWGEYDDGKNLSWANQPQLPTTRRPFERLANGFAVLFTNRGAPLIYYGDEVGLPGAGDPDNRRVMAWTGLSADQLWLRERVQVLLRVRAAHAALRVGARTTLSVTPDSWGFAMHTVGEDVYVAVNRSDRDLMVGGFPHASLTDELNGVSVTGPLITVPARSTRIMTR